MIDDDLVVPESWAALSLHDVTGPILIVGAANSGKSTLARFIYQRVRQEGRPVAYLDGDPGQSTLGPPATMTLALSNPDDANFPPEGSRFRWFVGSTTPRGHMLPLLAGAARLAQVARRREAEPILYDSSGLVDVDYGGAALKQALVDVLQPQLIIAIEREDELEPLLRPWRRLPGLDLVALSPAPAARQRNTEERQAYRAARFREHFSEARRVSLNPRNYAVTHASHWQPGQLLALRDADGFVLRLAIIQEQPATDRLHLWTPLADLDRVASLQPGDLLLDSQTYRDQLLR